MKEIISSYNNIKHLNKTVVEFENGELGILRADNKGSYVENPESTESTNTGRRWRPLCELYKCKDNEIDYNEVCKLCPKVHEANWPLTSGSSRTFIIYRYIYKANKENKTCTQAEITKFLGIESSAVNPLLRQLIEKGLIVRYKDPLGSIFYYYTIISINASSKIWKAIEEQK